MPQIPSYEVRFCMVRTCLEQLEMAYKSRSWKLGPIPPDAVKLMRVGGHSTLVAFISIVIAAEAGVAKNVLADLVVLGELHDSDEVFLGDVSWPQNRFSIRKKVEARAAIFTGLKAGDYAIQLLNRLDEKHGDGMSDLVMYHEDAHQIASLLEIMSYCSAKLAFLADFRHSIEKLRGKVLSEIGRTLFTDLERVTELPVRSAVKWEEHLWQQLGFPLQEFPVR